MEGWHGRQRKVALDGSGEGDPFVGAVDQETGVRGDHLTTS